MTRINCLTGDKQTAALEEAAERGLQAVLSLRREHRWLTYKTWFLSSGDVADGLVLACPDGGSQQPSPELAGDEVVGVSFRRGHKKCLFATKVVRRASVRLEDGVSVPAVVLTHPTEIRQVQRRAYNRTEVPAGRSIEVTLWEGGASARGETPGDSTPTFSGELVDISAGGLSIRLLAANDPRLEGGDTVTCRFRADPDSPPISLDVNFRHCEPGEDGQVVLGFQIVGLETTREGGVVLGLLSEFVKKLAQERRQESKPKRGAGHRRASGFQR